MTLTITVFFVDVKHVAAVTLALVVTATVDTAVFTAMGVVSALVLF